MMLSYRSQCRGIIAEGPTLNFVQTSTDADKAGELPLMSVLLASACRELVPAAGAAIKHKYASHIIRSALLVLSGKQVPMDSKSNMRSKKSQNWKAAQAPLRPLITEAGEKGKGKEVDAARKRVPDEFANVLAELVEALDVALGKGTQGILARNAATDAVPGVVLQVSPYSMLPAHLTKCRRRSCLSSNLSEV